MKKVLSIVLALVMAFGATIAAFAVDGAAAEPETGLRFNSDGKFKIMMLNDTQDVGKFGNRKMTTFLKTAVDLEKPDLVVFVGDQLSDVYPFATPEDFGIAIDNICAPLQERGIPFAVTMGNHDHDRTKTLSEDGMYELYARYSMCQNYKGNDYFTFNLPIYSNSGDKMLMNVYMIDSNNRKDGGYEGVRAEQVKWYEDTSNALAQANGGEIVPSMLFQHVPVKERYNLFKECSWTTKGSIYSRRDSKWYVLDEAKTVESTGELGEAPCSENFDVETGQYQSWLKQGDIIGAWFGHDHVNSYWGYTDDGIRMGYNGGTGFRSYGSGDRRSIRVFEFDENDVSSYTTRLLLYRDIVGSVPFVISDLLTPAILSYVMKGVYVVYGPIKSLINSLSK